MYDMYDWDRPDHAARGGGRHPSRLVRGTRHPRRGTMPAGPAAQAVQVALDRRDNGGDSGARRDQ